MTADVAVQALAQGLSASGRPDAGLPYSRQYLLAYQGEWRGPPVPPRIAARGTLEELGIDSPRAGDRRGAEARGHEKETLFCRNLRPSGKTRKLPFLGRSS